MAIDNGKQLSSGSRTYSGDSKRDLTEVEDEDLDGVDLTDYDEERVERVLEYEKQIQFAEKEKPPEPTEVSFRDAVWDALEENNLTARNITGRIQKVDVREDILYLTYIVNGEAYTTDVVLDSEQYARLLEYCEVPASAVQNLTGKQIPVQDSQDTSTEENHPLMLPKNNAPVAKSIYSVSRLLYKYRIAEAMSDEEGEESNGEEEESNDEEEEEVDSTTSESISQTLGIPVHVKFLILYVFGLVLLGVSLPFVPSEFEILNGFVGLLVLLGVVFSLLWGMIALDFAKLVIQSIHKNYIPI